MKAEDVRRQLNAGLQELLANLSLVREQLQDLARQEADLQKRLAQQRGALAVLEQLDAEEEEEDG